MKQVAEQTGIPYKHLKLIKELYPAGFNLNNSVNVDGVVQFYADNKELILETEGKTIDSLKKQRLEQDIILHDIEIQEAKKLSIPLKEVEDFFSSFGIQLGAVLKAKLTKELPPQIIGMKEEDVIKQCISIYNSIIELLGKNMDAWNKD
jgi:hypothetical protein